MIQHTVAGADLAGTASGASVGELVRASVAGSEAAWQELVRRYSPMVTAVIRRHQLAAEDAQDVSQTVWLRLVEHLAGLLDPAALPGWLAVTARRECGWQARQRRRDVPTDPQDYGVVQQLAANIELDADLLRAELRQALRDGLGQLPERDQRLLRLWSDDPPASYQEISAALRIPVGSIGPTLRRSLNRLRQTAAVRAYLRSGRAGQDSDSVGFSSRILASRPLTKAGDASVDRSRTSCTASLIATPSGTSSAHSSS
jgi:RNA polymerase sigma factor (sigma-70 family)